MRQDEDGESYLQNLPLDEVLELIDWASGFDVTAPKKSSVNAAVPTTRRILEFQDRYLTSKTSFTAYDASEGALYVLFLLCLACLLYTSLPCENRTRKALCSKTLFAPTA